MNTDSCCKKTSVCAYIIAALGTFLVMMFLVGMLRHYTEKPSLMAERGEERMKILKEFWAVNQPLVEKYDWQDKDKGIVRVPVTRAKELVLEEWQNPAKARADLMERAKKAFAPAPKPPPVKNPFE